MVSYEGTFSGSSKPWILFDKSVLADECLKNVKMLLKKNRNLLYVSDRRDAQEKNRRLNREFADDYGILHDDYIAMLNQLTAMDCIDISPNRNSDFPKVLVYEFRRQYGNLCYYGEPVEEPVDVYIKLYINNDASYQSRDPAYAYGHVVVISFHA